MMVWVIAASVLVCAGRPPIRVRRVACRRSGLVRLTGVSATAAVLPCRPAGQDGSGPGRPRYTACTSSRGQARGCRVRFSTGHDAGTFSRTPR